MSLTMCMLSVFFFNDTATTEIYTLSLHDALPIFNDLITFCRQSLKSPLIVLLLNQNIVCIICGDSEDTNLSICQNSRSEEHTSELQSRQYLVCRLLLEKKKHPPSTVALFRLTRLS